jgi:signal transduction histidine kinase
MMQSEKLALTGRLAASLAHEINNPLQSVIGCLDLAEESLKEQDLPAARRMLRIGVEELERAAAIVTQLRDLNRPTEPENRELADVKGLLDQVLLLTGEQYRKNRVEVSLETEPDLPWPRVAPDQIKQVFLNLILNAIEAMPDGGQLSMRVLHTGEPAGVSIVFSDTGQGMLPDVIAELFDPFFTTKKEGLGLGLYVSHNIIKEHSGHIDVESHMGKGSTFTVWLPVEEGGMND